jgi:hypothetical protein
MTMPIPKQEIEVDFHFYKTLPDPAICRTQPIWKMNSVALCLVDHPIMCRHGVGCENGSLCKHPYWRAFVKP